MTIAWSTIQQAIPALHTLPETEPPRIDAGQNAIVWDATPYIVRVPRFHTGNTSSAFHREAATLHVIGPHLPIPTPEMTVFDLPDDTATTVAIHPALPGHPLMTMPDDQAEAFAGSLGAFLRALHGVPLSALDGIAIPVANLGSWRTWLRQAIQQLTPHLDAAAIQRLGDAGDVFLEEIVQVSPVLIHGDFGGSNILAMDDAITGIIDFGGIQIGDPASDVAGLVSSYGASFLDRLEAISPEVGAMRGRIGFYRLAFAAMDALYGLDHADESAFRAGIASLAHPTGDGETFRQT